MFFAFYNVGALGNNNFTALTRQKQTVAAQPRIRSSLTAASGSCRKARTVVAPVTKIASLSSPSNQ
jgi:hypothetical protein